MNLWRVQTYKAQWYSIPEWLSAENVVRVKDFRNGHAEAWIRMYASGEYKRYLGQEWYDDAEVVQSLAPQGWNTYNPKRKEANPVDAVDIFATLFEPRGSITKLENMIKREDPALYISYQNAWKKWAIKHQDYFTLGKVYDNYHSTQPNKVLEDVRLMVSWSGSLIDTSQPSPSTKSTNSGATSTPSDWSTLTDDAGNVIKSAWN
jgi:hypothetical protein